MGKNEIDIVILGSLLQGPAHGYQLKQRIDLSFGQFYISLSTGSLYTRLQKFEADGYVEGRREQQEKLPDRRVFQLTEPGRRRLVELIATPVETTSTMWPELQDLTVHALFFSFITQEQREGIIGPLIERARRQQKAGEHAREAYGKEMDAYMLATVEWGLKLIDVNLKYFNALLGAD